MEKSLKLNYKKGFYNFLFSNEKCKKNDILKISNLNQEQQPKY